MSEDALTILKNYLTEALDLRFGHELPGPQATPQDIFTALLDVRQRLDRIEHFLAAATRARHRTRAAVDLATAVAEDAWDEQIHQQRQAPVSTGPDYTSAKERHAEANLATMDQRRAVRAAAATHHAVDEVFEVLKLTHRGLDGTRHDLLGILRGLQIETALER